MTEIPPQTGDSQAEDYRAKEEQRALKKEILRIMRREIGGCREWVGIDTCAQPAEYVLWGKLISPEGLGPRCYEHAAKHVDHYGLRSRSGYALINLNDLARGISAALVSGGVTDD